MADEYTDLSNKEQVTVCLRWVDSKELKVYMKIFLVDNIQSTTIVNAIKDALTTDIEMPRSNIRWSILLDRERVWCCYED